MEEFNGKKIANRIKELQTLLLSTYEYYLKKPKQAQLKALCRLSFELGYECARFSIYKSRNIKD